MGSATLGLAANILKNIAEHARRHLDADNAEMTLGQIVADQIGNGVITKGELYALAALITHPGHPDLKTSVDLSPDQEKFVFSSSRLDKAKKEALRRVRH